MNNIKEPFKIFSVQLEEEVTRTCEVLVQAPTIEDVRALSASDLAEGLDDSAWEKDGFPARVCNVKEEPPEGHDDIWAYAYEKKFIEEAEARKISEAYYEELLKRRGAPLPGQLGLSGIADDVK